MGGARELLLTEQADTLARIDALQREYSGIAEAASAPGTDDEHDPEGATLAFEREHTAALLNQARDQLAAVTAALARLDDGRYGICQRCGNPIAPARLAARPSTEACLTCATKMR